MWINVFVWYSSVRTNGFQRKHCPKAECALNWYRSGWHGQTTKELLPLPNRFKALYRIYFYIKQNLPIGLYRSYRTEVNWVRVSLKFTSHFLEFAKIKLTYLVLLSFLRLLRFSSNYFFESRLGSGHCFTLSFRWPSHFSAF